MRDVDVLFLYEHAQRELMGVLLVAEELIRRNMKIAVASIKDVHKASRLLKVKVMSVPFLYNVYPYRDIVGPFLKNSPLIKIVNRHEEQIWDEEQINDWILVDEFSRSAYNLCWGNYLKDLLLARGGDTDRIFVVGCPRAAIVYALKDKQAFLRDKLKLPGGFDKIILLATNFGGMYASNAKPELEETAVLLRTEFYKHLKSYVIRYPNVLFYIRVHPSEKVANITAEQEFSKYRNVYFSTQGTAAEAVSAADVVGTWTSSLAVEAWMAGKPSFGFMGRLAYQTWPNYPITQLTDYYEHMDFELELESGVQHAPISDQDRKKEERCRFIEYTYGDSSLQFIDLSASAYEKVLSAALVPAIPIRIRKFAHTKEAVRNFCVRRLNLWMIHPSWVETRVDVKTFPIADFVQDNRHVFESDLHGLIVI